MRYDEDQIKLDDPYYLYYDVDENIMVDDNGIVVHQIHQLVHPNYMYLFMENKEDMMVPSQLHPEMSIGLIYPLEGSLDSKIVRTLIEREAK